MGALVPAPARHTFQSVTGGQFTGRVVAVTPPAAAGTVFAAATVEVAGHAHYTGTSVFVVDPDDALADGFRLH